jgi:hypothetical protein
VLKIALSSGAAVRFPRIDLAFDVVKGPAEHRCPNLGAVRIALTHVPLLPWTATRYIKPPVSGLCLPALDDGR